MKVLCPCGALHEQAQAAVARLHDDPYVTVEVGERAWRVPRVYIAAHGIKASELYELALRYDFELIR